MNNEPPTRKPASRLRGVVGVLFLVNALLALLAWQMHSRNQRAADRIFADALPSVVARVDGKPIYARDLLSATSLDGKPPTTELLRARLREAIETALVMHNAHDTPIDPATLEARLESTRHQFPDAKSYATALAEAGLDEAALRDRFLRQLQAETWLLQSSAVEPTEPECLAWFEAHPDAFALPEAVEATHFSAIFPPRGTPMELLGKTDLILEAQKNLKGGGSFSALIENLSDDPAKKMTGGALGWFTHDRMEPALAEAAFTLPLNTISDPVQTRFGFHLLTVSNRLPAKKLIYDEVREEVRLRCRDELRRKKCRAIVAALRQSARVEILAPSLAHDFDL